MLTFGDRLEYFIGFLVCIGSSGMTWVLGRKSRVNDIRERYYKPT